jgi:murein DD-endopeptidase MepM/ murein hydrolase activator NlpD
MRFPVCAFALLVLAAPSLVRAAAPMDSTTALARARELSPYVSRGESGPLWRVFDDEMRGAMGDSTRFDALLTGILAQVGAIVETLSETVGRERGLWVYRARCQFAKVPEPALLLIAFAPDGRVTGLSVQPEERKEYPTTKLDYQTKTKLELPFKGEWFVAWGGRTLEQNQHAATKAQRFAYDILMIKGESTHAGDGKKLSDYYCYGAEILAPAAGTIVWSCDSLPDQTPGQQDPSRPIGNGVVIDHGNGEFSLIAHLQPHSQRFRAGNRVETGVVLGRCGNSGNTTEPHLHYHLQDGPDIAKADGLPARFVDLCVDGVKVDGAEPVRGQKIQPCFDYDAGHIKKRAP